MPDVFVGIGSNVDRELNTRKALTALGQEFGDLELSRVYESKSVGFEGDNFLNLVVRFKTTRTVAEIARILRAIEDDCGRDRGGINGRVKMFADRTMDLDILLYGSLSGYVDDIELPRPEISGSAHVLLPLAELAGDRLDPGTGRSYTDLGGALGDCSRLLWPVEFNWSGNDGSTAVD